MYKQAIGVHNGLIGHLRMLLQQGQDRPAEEKKQIEDTLANLYYNSACSHSLMKDYKWAYVKLQMCLDLVHDNYIKLIPRDGDFKNLREHEKFEKWFELAKQKKLPPLDLKKLARSEGEAKKVLRRIQGEVAHGAQLHNVLI